MNKTIFFVQIPDESPMSLEIRELMEVIDDDKFSEYKLTVSTYFPQMSDLYVRENPWLKKAIPVGSIEFVKDFLKRVHNIEVMNPIEVPRCLRHDKLLLRDYQIVPFDKIPDKGRYFIKDVSGLKMGSYCGDVENFKNNVERYHVDTSHLFQISSPLNIQSEYRVFVMDNHVYGIQFYDGDPTIMPSPDEINKIKEMILRYSMAKDCPKAYTMDVAIVKTNHGRDLALIEVHPFVSVGTYGCRGNFLIKMYQSGFEWYLKHNTEIAE